MNAGLRPHDGTTAGLQRSDGVSAALRQGDRINDDLQQGDRLSCVILTHLKHEPAQVPCAVKNGSISGSQLPEARRTG